MILIGNFTLWVNTKETKVGGGTIVDILGLSRGEIKLNYNIQWVKWTWLQDS